MGTTSEKLTYLNTTKEKIRDSINLTGANLTSEDTFRSYASKLKKGYIDIINNGIDTLYNNFPKVSGIGSNLSLTPTYEAPMKLNEIQGDTLQDGTPTPDTPVPIQSVTGLQNVNVCGKNLVSFNDLQTSNNTSYTWQNDILQISATTGTYNRAYKDITDLYKNNPSKKLRFDFTSYDFSQGNDAKIQLQIVSNGITSYETLVETSGTINTRTIPSDTSSITQVLLRLVSNNTSTSQASQISITKPILHFGSSATSYEPYKGNTYEVNLGKNLFDINGTVDVGTLDQYNNGFTLIKRTNRRIRFVLPQTLEAGTYTLSYDVITDEHTLTNYFYVSVQDSSDTNVLQNVVINSSGVTFTTSSSFSKLYFFISGSEDDTATITIDNVQLEKGSTSTSYSPYFTPIELNKIGDYQDRIYKDNGKWYIEKNTRKLELAIADMNNNENYPGWNNQTQLKQDFPNKNGLLKYFTKFMFNIGSENFEGVSINTTGTGTLFLGKTYWGSDYTQTYWKTNYPNLVFTMVYGIQTPTYTEITNTELIEDLETLYTAKSQDGTTNISITSEDLEMILNVSALKGDA